jgi:hypothetical protein
VKRALALALAAAAIALLATASSTNITMLQEVEVVARDYAFQIPSTLPAGLTTFRFRNDSKHRHEFNMFLLKPGVTIEQVITAGKEGKSQMALIDAPVGVLFAGKGKTSSTMLMTNLLPGRNYGVQCISRDTTDAPRHYELGMYSTVHIEAGPVKTTHVYADSVIAVDYAFAKYPREISAGRHTIAFRNAGKQRHEFGITLLKRGVTLDSVMAVDKRKGDVQPLFERHIGVLHSRGGETALGMLDINFLAGRDYIVECAFQDDDKSPPHFALGMQGSIHVSGTPGT